MRAHSTTLAVVLLLVGAASCSGGHETGSDRRITTYCGDLTRMLDAVDRAPRSLAEREAASPLVLEGMRLCLPAQSGYEVAVERWREASTPESSEESRRQLVLLLRSVRP